MAWDVLKNSTPHTWILQDNQVWVIELSHECVLMLHNAWLNVPYVFILSSFEVSSDKHI
jgi:hypothetical protein